MSDGLRHYLDRLLDAWHELAEPGAVRLGFFALLLGLTLLCRGRGAWSRRASWGVLATIVLVHFNLAAMPLLRLLELELQAGYDRIGLPRLPPGLWTHLPGWAVTLAAVVAYDLANYWNHRLMHTRWVWPVHAIHHSDPDVSGMTSFRVHALEGFVMGASYVLLLTWLRLPPDALAGLAAILILHNMYVHADLDWTHGPLELLIASPRYHRWHHADVPEAHGKNLANVIPLFDVLFGTYYCPGPCTAPLGAAGVPQHDPLRLFLFPGVGWLREARALGARLLARKRPADDADAPRTANAPDTSPL